MSKLREAAQQALEALLDDCLVKVGPHSWERRSDLAITALRAALAEPVQEPVAWIHTDPDKPRVRFLEWREDEPGYHGHWLKTPLYTAPQRCPNCASLEDQNTELDRKLAELERGGPVHGCPSCEYNKARAQLWRNEAYKLGGHPLDWEPELMVRPKPPCATGDCIPSKCNICEVKE